MKSETSLVAHNYKLQQWAAIIQECKSRPEGMLIKDWCQERGISKDSYYYWLKLVREACLESMPEQANQLAKVPSALVKCQAISSSTEATTDISINGCIIHVNNQTSPEMLSMILQVISNAK